MRARPTAPGRSSAGRRALQARDTRGEALDAIAHVVDVVVERLEFTARDRVARRVEAELAEIGGDTVLNLASKEYWRVVEPHLSPGTRVVTVDFRDRGPWGPRFNSFVAKRARGAMARMMCELGATTAEELHGFDGEGYAYAGTSVTGAGHATMSFLR